MVLPCHNIWNAFRRQLASSWCSENVITCVCVVGFVLGSQEGKVQGQKDQKGLACTGNTFLQFLGTAVISTATYWSLPCDSRNFLNSKRVSWRRGGASDVLTHPPWPPSCTKCDLLASEKCLILWRIATFFYYNNIMFYIFFLFYSRCYLKTE